MLILDYFSIYSVLSKLKRGYMEVFNINNVHWKHNNYKHCRPNKILKN